MCNLKIDYEDKKVNIKINQIKFVLPEIGKVKLDAEIHLIEEDKKEKISFTTIPESLRLLL